MKLTNQAKFFLAGLTLILIVFAVPNHIRKALIYQKADIDDYRIFENRVVSGGEHQPWKLHPEYNKRDLSADKLKAFESFKPTAFLIIRDTSILFERYWDGYNDTMVSNSFSMAKSIVGLLTGIAIDEGYIKDINQPASDFIPSYRNGPNASLTIRNLLVMAASLDWDESYSNLFSSTTKAYYGTNLESQVLDLKVTGQPGITFSYQSSATLILGYIIEKATGKTLSDYASEKLWKPLGARVNALWSLSERDGLEKAYCCFNSNARDFARIGQLVLNGGTWNGQRLVPENYLKEAVSPATDITDNSGKPVDFYGYQWWILNYKGLNIPYARGILGQYILVIPEKNAVVVRLGHERSKERTGMHTNDVYLYLDAALEMLEKN